MKILFSHMEEGWIPQNGEIFVVGSAITSQIDKPLIGLDNKIYLNSTDGRPAIKGDRVLVVRQIDASKNGIYIASDGIWKRWDLFDRLISHCADNVVIKVLRVGNFASEYYSVKVIGDIKEMSGSQIEKLHTAYMCGEMVDRYLVDRDDLTEDERKLAEQAMDNLYDLYQIVGSRM